MDTALLSQPTSQSHTPPATGTGSSPSANSSDGFVFPPHYSFPPFFTLQPNTTTLSRQLALWSSLIRSYCAHNRLFRLSLSTAVGSPPFRNATIDRQLDILSIRRVIEYMVSADGDNRAEWVPTQGNSKKPIRDSEKNSAWIYWRRPEEWADAVYAWVDGTGQKGSVLTIYELRESDAVQGQDWIGMEEDMLRRCLDVLVKRGKAQVFGADEGAGVKFF